MQNNNNFKNNNNIRIQLEEPANLNKKNINSINKSRKTNDDFSTYKIYKKDPIIKNNSMLGKKVKKSEFLVYNPSCEALIKKITGSLFYLKEKIKDIEKNKELDKTLKQKTLNTLNNQKKELEELSYNLKDIKNSIKKQKIKKSGEILNNNIENEVNNLQEKIDFKTQEISNTLDSISLKITNNNSYLVGYGKLGKINGPFVKNVRANISHLWGNFEKLCNYNEQIQKMYGEEILKFIIENKLKPTLKKMVKEPEKSHENTKAYINFEYDILCKVFKIFKTLKELKYKPDNNNSLKNKFLKNLIDKYLLTLKITILNNKKDDYKNIIANFTSSQYYKFIKDIECYISNVKKISMKKISCELRELLSFVPVFYNIFSVLGYVDKEGTIINSDAKNVMKTLLNKIISASYSL